MLIKEMRGRERSERNNNNGPSSNDDDDDGGNSSTHNTSSDSQTAQETSSQRAEQQSNSDAIDIDDIDPPSTYESQSISERIQYYFTKFISWYQNQSEDMQTILKVSFGFLLLYIALGGRFGLEYVGRKPSRGNYGHGNAYERYHGHHSTTNSASRNNDRYGYVSESSTSTQNQGGPNANRAQTQSSSSGSGYNDRTNPENSQYYSRYSQYDDEEYYEPPRQSRSSRRTSSRTYHMPNLFDGSFTSLIIMFIIGTICHRFGINPFQVFWLLRAMQGGGRHHHGYPMGGYGGFGGGFGGRRGRMGRRGRW